MLTGVGLESGPGFSVGSVSGSGVGSEREEKGITEGNVNLSLVEVLNAK